ncbi:hypothetical protein SAMN05216308_10542 [Nitrosospira sp. Nsp13]|nr:hypothetical protein SAMN05216308_10542 [Nitrosospira sp. Nsp13]
MHKEERFSATLYAMRLGKMVIKLAKISPKQEDRKTMQSNLSFSKLLNSEHRYLIYNLVEYGDREPFHFGS